MNPNSLSGSESTNRSIILTSASSGMISSRRCGNKTA